jgi:hypothetical protein
MKVFPGNRTLIYYRAISVYSEIFGLRSWLLFRIDCANPQKNWEFANRSFLQFASSPPSPSPVWQRLACWGFVDRYRSATVAGSHGLPSFHKRALEPSLDGSKVKKRSKNKIISKYTTSKSKHHQIRSSSRVFFMLPLVWYSVTRVSKMFFSFLRKITSSNQGNGLALIVDNPGSPRLLKRRSALNST